MALVGFDISISLTKSTNDYRVVANNLKQIFKKWAFQKEIGESGYEHWQVRGHLWKPTTLNNACTKFRELTWNGHWSITSGNTHSGNNFNYVMKADTRISGPWTSEEELEKPKEITRQLKTFMGYLKYSWQIQIENSIQEEDDRHIKVIVDTVGNIGKSIFAEYLEYKDLGYEIPPMICMEDIMQCAMGIKPQKCYIIDMPRGMKKEKLAGFYSGLEALKNGVMYDKRYKFEKRRIDRPQILVFTNKMPDLTLMSPDRWIIWNMKKDKSLELLNLWL